MDPTIFPACQTVGQNPAQDDCGHSDSKQGTSRWLSVPPRVLWQWQRQQQAGVSGRVTGPTTDMDAPSLDLCSPYTKLATRQRRLYVNVVVWSSLLATVAPTSLPGWNGGLSDLQRL